MEFFIVWACLAALMGWFAHSRGHSFLGGFLIALILSPLIGLVITVMRRPKIHVVQERAVESGEMRKCPMCAELVRKEAKKCKHCGDMLPEFGQA